ncbi:MAG TPA: hypothetical protein VJ001_05475 [Rhodocyclaceae bacterium]|nr:hypothetical protein [Rhodocyclaceae bacterium]
MDTKIKLYDFVMGRLRDGRVTRFNIAVGSGVPYATVVKIAQGSVKSPSVHTIQKLADFFEKLGADAPDQAHKEVA